MPGNTTCNDPVNQGRYIEDFECSNDSTRRLLKEMRLSFPSGHSSFSAYTLIYLAVSDPFTNSRPRGNDLLIFVCIPDLPPGPDDMARIHALAPLPAVPFHNDDLVHVPQPHLRLQAPLVRRSGRSYFGSRVRVACCQLCVRFIQAVPVEDLATDRQSGKQPDHDVTNEFVTRSGRHLASE